MRYGVAVLGWAAGQSTFILRASKVKRTREVIQTPGVHWLHAMPSWLLLSKTPTDAVACDARVAFKVQQRHATHVSVAAPSFETQTGWLPLR